MDVYCDYCGEKARKVRGAEVYPHRRDLAQKWFYKCDPCGAWVGCHPKTEVPMGRLANAELRRMKSLVHKEFDPLWKDGGMSRTKAYRWLSSQMGIRPSECHIGMFSEDRCQYAIDVIREHQSNNSPDQCATSSCP